MTLTIHGRGSLAPGKLTGEYVSGDARFATVRMPGGEWWRFRLSDGKRAQTGDHEATYWQLSEKCRLQLVEQAREGRA